ncbi:hypothetical protein R1sor_022735 [Riccia sorocarpa]|uniref:Reverse transcriptase zinc-binding domain-containing protein n=1 Tax=Riccia sorocarpa TaxID=122646 RepID=A0ABD3GPX8_9MARC
MWNAAREDGFQPALIWTDHRLSQITGWQWIEGWKVGENWGTTSRCWSHLFWTRKLSFKGLSGRWETRVDSQIWNQRWKRLWKGTSLYRHKVWIWKVIQRGLPVCSKFANWGVSDGVCLICLRGVETIEHVLWECPQIRGRVEWVQMSLGGEQVGHDTFLSVLDKALAEHNMNPGPLILLSEHCRRCWTERNRWIFEGKLPRIPLSQIIIDVTDNVKASLYGMRGEKAEIVGRKSASFIAHMSRMAEVWGSRHRAVANVLRKVMDISNDDITSSLEFSESSSDCSNSDSSSDTERD